MRFDLLTIFPEFFETGTGGIFYIDDIKFVGASAQKSAPLTAPVAATSNYIARVKTDTEAAFNAANITLTKNPKFKHWIAFGLNDEAVLGAVRAAEGHGVKPADIIGVGIGGSQSAMNEFAKPEKTGFFGTVLISPKRHGYETSLNMYDWIKNNKAPDPLILTSGRLMTRDNEKAVRQEMGL